MKLILLVVASLLLSVSGLAQPEPAPTDLVIVGGGKVEADATKARDAFAKKIWLYARQKTPPSTLQIMKSDDVKGLKPGLFVAVAAACRHELSTKDSRKSTADAIRAVEKGAYVRTVTDAVGHWCPARALFAAPSPEEKKLRDAIDAGATAKALVAYATYLKEAGRLDEATLVVDEAVALEPGHVEAKNLAEILTVLQTD